jgi:hypothetical protein
LVILPYNLIFLLPLEVWKDEILWLEKRQGAFASEFLSLNKETQYKVPNKILLKIKKILSIE